MSSMKQLPHKITREEAIERMFENEDIMMPDIKLRGTDGIGVPAHRGMLAARSSVFERMFCGSFTEQSKGVVELKYGSYALKNLVAFIYAMEYPLFRRKPSDDDPQDNIDMAQQLVETAQAALFLGLPELCREIERTIRSILVGHKGLLCPLLNLCYDSVKGDPVTKNIKDIVIESAREDVNFLLKKASGLSSLNSNALAVILQDKYIQATEFKLVVIIKKWCTDIYDTEDYDVYKTDEYCNEDVSFDFSTKVSDDRKDEATELIRRCIDLHFIRPRHLLLKIIPTNLVSTEDMLNASLVRQGMKTDLQGIYLFSHRRCDHRWDDYDGELDGYSTCCDVGRLGLAIPQPFSLLDSPTMKTGVHKWSLKFRKKQGRAFDIYTGVSSVYNYGEIWGCTEDGKSIYYPGNAAAYANKIEVDLPAYYEGSTITFLLDLEDPKGRLHMKVDDRGWHELFNDMSKLKKLDGSPFGLVPVVGGKTERGARRDFEFLGFENVDSLEEELKSVK